ncbi:MAG TPA: hypothetical protein DCX54_03790 [Flavobacteriales bacterium]|nr:hypothetical protein [Flavobacteriales bacterium]
MIRVLEKRKPSTFILFSLVFFAIPVSFGLLSLYLGKDINWDLKNYHYYNAYAFLENRLDFDIAPAQLQTFINPIADIPFYLITKSFPSWVAGFIFGFIHGLNLSAVFLIFWKLSNQDQIWKKKLLGICIVITSGIAPGFISELGNTMHDNLTSVFVLSAILLLLIAIENFEKMEFSSGFVQVSLAGLIMGIGVGIKPSITIFAIGSTCVLMLFLLSHRIKLLIGFITYGFTGIIGGVTSAGFWWWELWTRFQNPFFPFYNHIFKSSYFTSSQITWSKFLPREFWEYFAWPFIFTLDSYRTNQLQFFDIRFTLLYVLCIAWLIISAFRKFYLADQNKVSISDDINRFEVRKGNFLLIFFLVSYILWIITSATYRFMIPLELLTPLCFLIIIDRLLLNKKIKTILVIGATILTFILYKPFNWVRLNWSDSYFMVDTSQFNASDEAIVVMFGKSPTSYIIPAFPPNYRFVRPEGNLGMQQNNSPLLIGIKNLLSQHKGNIYLLYNKDETNIDLEQSLDNLELKASIENCFILNINTPDTLEICRLTPRK